MYLVIIVGFLPFLMLTHRFPVTQGGLFIHHGILQVITPIIHKSLSLLLSCRVYSTAHIILKLLIALRTQ